MMNPEESEDSCSRQSKRYYDKVALSFNDQIKLLLSRGMIIEDQREALSILRHVNYYRLEAYWFTYYVKNVSEHRFVEGTTFELIWKHYRFDRKLRELIIHALERIEISFRTQFTYFLAHNYGPFPLVKQNFRFSNEDWDNHYKDLKKACDESKEQFAIHFRKCYTCELFPIWALTEIMSFGKIILFYQNLDKSSIKKSISGVYSIRPDLLDSWLSHLRVIRNICAHHNRMWNRRFVMTPADPQILSNGILSRWHNQPEHPTAEDPRNDRRLYNSILMIDYLLSKICPEMIWSKQIVSLITEYDIDAHRMGFPENWEHDAYWQV